MQTLFDDFLRGVQELLESPDFVAIAVLCLTLGIWGSRLWTLGFCC